MKPVLYRTLLPHVVCLFVACSATAFVATAFVATALVATASAQDATLEVENQSSSGSLTYFRFDNIKEVISGWNQSQHLYVRGDPGLSPAELLELEGWLHANGPHWTVILMEDASSQRYTNQDGRVQVGMDAVELSMSDLMEVGSYRQQILSDTGEQDAAVFILYLRERKFSYRASQAQERRNLGQNRWIGKLDRPAYRAMRGGGRVLDAVRDTVLTINNALQRSIAEEKKIAAERELQRQRDMDRIAARLGQVEEKLGRIESAAKVIREEKPTATADLTSPDIADIRTQLSALREAIKATDAEVGKLRENTNEITDNSDDWLNLYNEYKHFDASESQLQQRLDHLRGDAGDLRPAIDDSLAKVDTMLKEARAAYEIADSSFQKNLNAATHALENADQQLIVERQNLERSRARRSFVRRTIIAAAGVLSTIVAGLLFWLNRRRGPAKQRAVARLEERAEEVKKEMEGVGDLLKRADVVIGDREAIERKGYQGKTKDLSANALDDIDDILVMSGSVEKVMDGAKEKIQPESWWRQFTNWWSAENYNEGFDLLENKPIEFSENDGISLVHDELDAVQNDGTSSPAAIQPAEGKKKTISLSFTDLFKVFRQRSARVQDTISQVETGWTQIVSTNSDLQKAIDEAYANELLAREATEQDGLLSVPQLFDDLLKSAQADQDAAEELGKHDPISAIEGPATDGLRKAANANELSEQLIQSRTLFLPSIRENAQKLDERGREVEWIDAALADFTDRAQTLATDALEQNVEDGIDEWRVSFEKFTAAIGRSVELHDQSVGEVTQAIADATAKVSEARHTIASRLRLPHENILVERNREADRMLQAASEHNAAALASLDRGDPPAGELSIAESLEWSATANRTASESLRILDELPQQTDGLAKQLETVAGTLPEQRRLLESMQNRFTDSALMIDGASLENEQTDETVSAYTAQSISASDLFRAVERQREAADSAIHAARKLYAEGRLLEADDSYRRAAELTARADHNLKLLANHAGQLERMLADNLAGLGRLQGRFEQLEGAMRQHHVTRSTQETARSLHQKFTEVKRTIESDSGRRDPAGEAALIADSDSSVDRIHMLTQTDQAAYDEAVRSVESLRQLVQRAESTTRRSQTDQIPDSGRVRSELESIRNAAATADSLKSRLQTAHEDWTGIDQQADAALSAATQSLANLQSELDRAQAAASAIQSASTDYQQAINWSGSYGIRANPRSARGTLDRARDALSRGDYQAAIAIAQQSSNAIQNAIASAQNEVMRREAAERRERERRRRAASGGVIGGGSILRPGRGSGSSRGWSGGSSGRSSSGRSSSGGSSSGGSSSGSGGFSRSGW